MFVNNPTPVNQGNVFQVAANNLVQNQNQGPLNPFTGNHYEYPPGYTPEGYQ